jgi:hypothetical protein
LLTYLLYTLCLNNVQIMFDEFLGTRDIKNKTGLAIQVLVSRQVSRWE